jgi:CheY-like chemotaxis protein
MDEPKTILLVEDEVLIAMSEQMTLEINGYQVVLAGSGEEAVKAVETTPGIDFILMDIDLGKGIDGTETAAIILKDRDLPVVFLSSHTEPEIVEKTEKITSYGYIVKGSNDTVLLASIKMAFKLFEAKISVQKKEVSLRESEYKYRMLFENMNIPFGLHEIICDDNGQAVDYRFLEMNPLFLKNIGRTVSEVKGHTTKELFPNTEQYWIDIFG